MLKSKDKSRVDDTQERPRSKRTKRAPVPRFSVGDRVVVRPSWSQGQYMLVEIKDLITTRTDRFKYYGIVLKATHHKQIDRIGHLTDFVEAGYGGDTLANVPEGSIKWLAGE